MIALALSLTDRHWPRPPGLLLLPMQLLFQFLIVPSLGAINNWDTELFIQATKVRSPNFTFITNKHHKPYFNIVHTFYSCLIVLNSLKYCLNVCVCPIMAPESYWLLHGFLSTSHQKANVHTCWSGAQRLRWLFSSWTKRGKSRSHEPWLLPSGKLTWPLKLAIYSWFTH